MIDEAFVSCIVLPSIPRNHRSALPMPATRIRFVQQTPKRGRSIIQEREQPRAIEMRSGIHAFFG